MNYPSDIADRLAQRVGELEATLRNTLAEYTGKGTKPQAGCAFATMIAGDAEVLVEYEYEAGEEAKTSGPPERCVSIIQALVNGRWCDPEDVFSESLIERWAEKIAEDEADAANAEQDEADDWRRQDDAREAA